MLCCVPQKSVSSDKKLIEILFNIFLLILVNKLSVTERLFIPISPPSKTLLKPTVSITLHYLKLRPLKKKKKKLKIELYQH